MMNIESLTSLIAIRFRFLHRWIESMHDDMAKAKEYSDCDDLVELSATNAFHYAISIYDRHIKHE